MSAKQNMSIVRQAVQAVNDRNLSLVSELVTPNLSRHDLTQSFGGDFVGPQGASDFLELALAAIPDIKLKIERIFGTDEYVAAHIIAAGTHQGEFFGIEPTGKRIEFNQINLYRFEDGKIAETWQLVDFATFLQQIGYLKL